MKTVEISVNDKSYVVGRLNAKDSTFITLTIFMPIYAALETAAAGGSDSFTTILNGLDKKQYDFVTDSLFSLVKVKESNVLCNVFSNGNFIYENVVEDPDIYLSILKASFELSFGDFFDSAARLFPLVSKVWGGIKMMREHVSNALASE